SVRLGKFLVPPGERGQAQFLGVLFNTPIVTRVIITAGAAQVFNFSNGQVTAGLPDLTVNAVQYADQSVADDFIIAEPVAATSTTAAVAFSAANRTDVTTSLDTFRTAIGGVNNGGTAT